MVSALRGIVAAIFLGVPCAAAHAEFLTPGLDLRRDAEQSRTEQRPILALVTSADCAYCEAVKHGFYHHMTGDVRIILREIDLSVDRSLIDFDGRSVARRDFARRHRSLFTPTVLFLDFKGNAVAAPLVGVATMDYYGFYLEKRITESLDALRAR